MNQINHMIYFHILLFLGSIATLIMLTISNNIHYQTVTVIIAYLINIEISSIITVPIISILYSFLNRNKMFYKTKSDNIIEGQRSLKL